jgi:hypothetical protein
MYRIEKVVIFMINVQSVSDPKARENMDSRIPRTIFGRGKVTGKSRKSHNEELHNNHT